MLLCPKSGRRWLLCLPFMVLAALPARGQDLGTYSVGQQLILPLDISQLDGEVAIEIDAIDVTGFAAITNGQLVIDLGPVLDDGTHEVTVYLFQGDDYQVIGSYIFSMSGGGRAEPVSVELQATHEAEARRVNGETELEASSGGQVNFNSSDQSISGHIGYIATSRTAEQINGKPFNITEYALRYQQDLTNSSLSATLGHQTLSFDPLLVDALNRRGLSFSVARHDERFRADIFALSAQDALGFENFSGLEDSNDRIYGMHFGFRPVAANDLTFSMQIYEGRGTPFGALVAGEGSGYSLGFDDTARDGRLRYGAHFGMTRWDKDAGGPMLSVSGEATSAYVSYDVIGDTASTRQVTLGMTYDAVDFDFESLANPGLPPGSQTFGLTADYSNDRWWLGLTAETSKTNFGGPGNLETDRINLLQIDGTYELLNTGRFDSRTLRFGAYAEWQDRLETPPAADVPRDYFDTGFNINLDQSNARTTMTLGYSLDNRNDQDAANVDELRQMASFHLSQQINDQLSMTAGLSSEWVDASFDTWWTHDASLLIDYQTANDWLLSLELATTQTDDPFASDGYFAMAQASRPIGRSAELVLYGSWGDGPYATESETTHDAILGVILRANTNILR